MTRLIQLLGKLPFKNVSPSVDKLTPPTQFHEAALSVFVHFSALPCEWTLEARQGSVVQITLHGNYLVTMLSCLTSKSLIQEDHQLLIFFLVTTGHSDSLFLLVTQPAM